MKLQLRVALFEKNAEDRPVVDRQITVPFRVPASLLLGFLVGVFFHYLLYRISLPSHPFIYVNF